MTDCDPFAEVTSVDSFRRMSEERSTLSAKSGCDLQFRYAKAAADFLEASCDDADVEVIAGHAGPAYGVPHDATVEAIKLAGALEALALDPVYSGKGLAGLIALVRTGWWQPD